MMTLSARPRTAATNSNLRDELELARRPLCHVAQHNRFAPIGLQAHVIRVERVAVPDHEHDVVRARTWMLDAPVRNGHRSNRLTCLCSESEESRMASSCSENSERRLSNLSVSVLPLFAALLPVMTQPATDTPIVTTHPAMVTHNPFIDSSPNCSARTSQMRDDTDFRRGPGGSPNAARHHTRKGGA